MGGCGTTRIPWSIPIHSDGATWRFSVQMSPLGLLAIDNVLEYDAASALLRRRSGNGGWDAPSEISPPKKSRRANGLVFVDVDTLQWMFRIGLDTWKSQWLPL